MKSLLTLLALLTVLAGSPQAQDFKPFQLYLATGAQLLLSDRDVEFAITLEPAYRINDNISVGLRLQVGGLSRTVEVNVDGTPYSWADHSQCISLTLNGKYYFTNTSFRPYAGFGLGLYDLEGYSPTYFGFPVRYSVNGAGKFGFYPRIGFDWGRFNFNVDLNLLGPVEATVYSYESKRATTVKNSNLAVTLGFFLFGGKRG